MKHLKTFENKTKIKTFEEKRNGYDVVIITLVRNIEILKFEGAHNEIDIFDPNEAEQYGEIIKSKKGSQIKGYLLETIGNILLIEGYNTGHLYYVPLDMKQYEIEQTTRKYNL